MVVINDVQTTQVKTMDGNQLRAARALLDWPQSTVAEKAGLHVNSVRYWERRASPQGVEEGGLQMIRRALEKQGVMFIPGGVQLAAEAA